MRRNVVMITTIIILIIMVVSLGLGLMARNSAIDSVIDKYQKQYSDGVLLIKLMRGEEAIAAKSSITEICSRFSLDEFYIAQIDVPQKQKSILYVLNPITGATECLIDRSTNVGSAQGLAQNVLATVNADPIYVQEFLAIYNALPLEQKTNASAQQIFDQLVSNKLLAQEAERLGLNVTEQEVESAMQGYLASTGQNMQDLEAELARQQTNTEAFRATIKRKLLIQKAIAYITKDVAQITQEQASEYYRTNTEKFLLPERASTRQILILANQTNKDEKLEQIKAIGNLVNTTDFCELVREYSEDAATKNNCGLYEFEKGQLLPEYEEVAFSSIPGSIKIIGTRLGYHIVKLENKTEPRLLSYEEIEPDLISALTVVARQDALNQKLEELRAQADIVRFTS